jgi:LacI family transcriptional regulator
MATKSHPTIRTLATEAGVSPMAVSLALRNHQSISAKLRARIQRLANARGYRPDPAIAKLMHHLRTKRPARSASAICALTTNAQVTRFVYFGEMMKAVRLRAQEMGYAFEQIYLEDYRDNSAGLQRVLRNRGIEGVLLMPMGQPQNLDYLFDWDEFSVVATSYSVVTPQFHRVVPYMFSNLKLACQKLVERGYRRIGLTVTANMDQRTFHHFSAAMAWHNANHPPSQTLPPLIEENLTAERIAAWLRREKPDVFISSANLPALEAAERAGLRVPQDIGVVFHSVPKKPRATAIDERPAEIGSTAIGLLSSMIQCGERGIPAMTRVTMIEGAWIEGQTVRPARNSDATSTARKRGA